MQIILDSITEGVFTIDLDKNITSFNKAAEKITGVPKEEAIGRKCYEVF
ncbi:MAG TPA: PAS domain-containing protein, partial [Deltaproteobacteria bacterium]|nr:PAS domain-containing protein [Deltaproteobacteria bacterium]